MNRETLDTSVRLGLVEYAKRCLVELGFEFTNGESPLYMAHKVKQYERALLLVRDDAERLKIVEELLKEVNR